MDSPWQNSDEEYIDLASKTVISIKKRAEFDNTKLLQGKICARIGKIHTKYRTWISDARHT
ncbi:hypothetical protein [Undibacterium sp. TS12]|uniref:hypothetical protein n=1 Tax=Undibacterium sp. TS12 TaxID=2908202 RepID=UPI001F4CE830|nr:hypothetical protein [Undibacterium sp. TS12]MCH8620959.1 hypothetical protein [Undibacterium sp. TS12]